MESRNRKVLWLCNIMLPAVAAYLGRPASNKEGWLSGLASVLLERKQENGIELHIAFPVEKELDGFSRMIPMGEDRIHCYGFYEDVVHAENYDAGLEGRLAGIVEECKPDIVHIFGTEYAHAYAMTKAFPYPERILLGIQGICQVIGEAYMADLPDKVQNSVTFRDWLKKDSLLKQQEKFYLRGKRETQIIKGCGNITGRTEFDREYTRKCNPKSRYFAMNETLRENFYQGRWNAEDCEEHTIFLSQGDYPVKGLHYMLLALPAIQKVYPDVKIKVAGANLLPDGSLKGWLKLSGYGKYLYQLVKKGGLKERVVFLGRLTAEEMKREYLNSGLYVCCSSVENSPNSLGEAMLLGMPCVAAAVGGIPSLFTDGQDGILYGECRETGEETENELNNNCELKTIPLINRAEQLANAVLEIWKNKEKKKAFGDNARLHAENTHNRESNYQKMTEIYSSILHKVPSCKEPIC